MKKKKILVMCSLALLALGCEITPTSSHENRIEVEAIEVKCSYIPGEEWISDGIYHSRNGTQTGPRIPLTADDPVGDDPVVITTTVNLNLNPETGKGIGWGTFESDNFVGTWNGKFIEREGIWLPSGNSVGHGISQDFDGWELVVSWESTDPSAFAGKCPGNTDPISALDAKATYLIPNEY
jgi:hypothetical protein